MAIDREKLYKFFKDTGIINSVNESLYANTYCYELKSSYNSYIDGVGMDYSVKSICVIKKTVNYNGRDIPYSYSEKTYSSADGYDPEKISDGDLLESRSITLNNELLINNPIIISQLEELIISNFNITEELIDAYNKSDKENTKRIEDQISAIIKLDKEINETNKTINSLQKKIDILKKSVHAIENSKREIKHDLLLNPSCSLKEEKEKPDDEEKTII